MLCLNNTNAGDPLASIRNRRFPNERYILLPEGSCARARASFEMYIPRCCVTYSLLAREIHKRKQVEAASQRGRQASKQASRCMSPVLILSIVSGHYAHCMEGFYTFLPTNLERRKRRCVFGACRKDSRRPFANRTSTRHVSQVGACWWPRRWWWWCYLCVFRSISQVASFLPSGTRHGGLVLLGTSKLVRLPRRLFCELSQRRVPRASGQTSQQRARRLLPANVVSAVRHKFQTRRRPPLGERRIPDPSDRALLRCDLIELVVAGAKNAMVLPVSERSREGPSAARLE